VNTLMALSSMRDLQKYVAELEAERGFLNDTVAQKCILLGEEVGELFRAIRRAEGVSIDVHDQRDINPSHELADILIVLATIANRLQIDLEDALREKEIINDRRSWA
jgi:NTP pyrophosphatase (non-canonical NTP hydrolase)